MTVSQLAVRLNVSERAVQLLARRGAIPSVKMASRWRFREAAIDAWLDDQRLGLRPREIEVSRPELPCHLATFARCFEVGHIVSSLSGGTKASVVAELAVHAHSLGLVRDPAWFGSALLQRETVMPNVFGNGSAFLHTLRRSPDQVVRPFLILGRSLTGIESGVLEGEVTHLFFVLGLKYDELQIPWLSKLVQLLTQPGMLQSLLRASDATLIYHTLAGVEQHRASITPKAEAIDGAVLREPIP